MSFNHWVLHEKSIYSTNQKFWHHTSFQLNCFVERALIFETPHYSVPNALIPKAATSKHFHFKINIHHTHTFSTFTSRLTSILEVIIHVLFSPPQQGGHVIATSCSEVELVGQPAKSSNTRQGCHFKATRGVSRPGAAYQVHNRPRRSEMTPPMVVSKSKTGPLAKLVKSPPRNWKLFIYSNAMEVALIVCCDQW